MALGWTLPAKEIVNGMKQDELSEATSSVVGLAAVQVLTDTATTLLETRHLGQREQEGVLPLRERCPIVRNL